MLGKVVGIELFTPNMVGVSMLLIYKKSDKETLTHKEKSIIKNRVKDLKKNQ